MKSFTSAARAGAKSISRTPDFALDILAGFVVVLGARDAVGIDDERVFLAFGTCASSSRTWRDVIKMGAAKFCAVAEVEEQKKNRRRTEEEQKKKDDGKDEDGDGGDEDEEEDADPADDHDADDLKMSA
jgi:hypothetical protein